MTQLLLRENHVDRLVQGKVYLSIVSPRVSRLNWYPDPLVAGTIWQAAIENKTTMTIRHVAK